MTLIRTLQGAGRKARRGQPTDQPADAACIEMTSAVSEAPAGPEVTQALAQALDETVRLRREARIWRIQAKLLALSQGPQSVEAYIHQVLSEAQHLLDASQVAFWRYDAEDDCLELSQTSCPQGEAAIAPIPLGVIQEAVENRQVRTAALNDGRGGLTLYMVGPVFNEQTLIGVFQVFSRQQTLSTGTEEELATLIDVVANGLRTVKFYEQLSYQASHDPLTGLANRRTFQQFIARELKLAQRHGDAMGLLVIDVDHFKRYNDSFGHPAGDALLVALSRCLEKAVRNTDFVARYGGEEFVVVLPHADAAGAAAAGQKVLNAIRKLHEEFPLPGGPVTASIGAASFPAHGGDPVALFEAADQAMYRAKHGGRNQVR